jgi:hypothetical protein
MKALKKVKKSKKAKKAKRKARATQNMSQIVNIKGLGGIGSPPQPFIFQAQREGPISSSEDFFTKALKQLNRVNVPSENIQEVKENMRKLERDLSKQAMTNKQLMLESDLLKTKYDNIASRTDGGVGDFSQKNRARDVAKQEEKFQDKSVITAKRGNLIARSPRTRKARMSQQTIPSMFSSQPMRPFEEQEETKVEEFQEPIGEEIIDESTRRFAAFE